MDSRVKILGTIIALCAALATGPGLAQEDSPPTGRDAPQPNGAADDSVAKGFAIPPGPDGSRIGPPPLRTGDGKEGAATTNSGLDPVRAEGGSAGLHRRANLKALITNQPKTGTGPSALKTHIVPPLVRPVPEGGAAHNAIGAIVPGGGQGFGHAVPGFSASAATGVRSLGSGVVGVGTPAGNVSSIDVRRSAIAPTPVTSPAAHSSGINGTTMGHIASGPASIGGPARDRSGINGTAVRPRY